MSQWIPVSERLPEPNVDVVVIGRDDRVFIAHPCSTFRASVWVSYSGTTYAAEAITHWMPLPDPPPRKLTHEEALRKAYESIIKFRMDDDSAKGLTSNYTALRPYTYFDDILPKLREALE